MRIRVTDDIEGLAVDLTAIAMEAPTDMADMVRHNADAGARYAKSFAKQSAGKHGKLYPRTITTERTGLLQYEYGPDSALPQGGMSFEFGSRNQPPHLDLAKSADLIGPRFARDVEKLPDRWFW